MTISSIRSARVVLPDGTRAATVHVADGRIRAIAAYQDAPADCLDAGEHVVLPGLVDTHVHVNEPGRTDWEGFETATRAAAAGGITAIVDMPLNSIPATTSADALRVKRDAAAGQCRVDVAFWGGVVPGNAGELDALVDAGVRGFKCFLVPSGVDEFPAVSERDLREALPAIARARVPLLVHAELPAFLGDLTQVPDGAAYVRYLDSRPPEAEVEAIRLMARLAEEFGARVHVVHVSSEEGATVVARARAGGVPLSAETCPHYLTFAAEDIPPGATQFKCAPPIRAASHRSALWRAIRSGTFDLIASDHSPAPPALKCPGNFARAWGGIASLEVSLAAVWTAARAATAPLTAADVARLMSGAPARLAGLHGRKGRIDVGLDADFCIWDPDRITTVDAARLQQRHKTTPYAGRQLAGGVAATILRGEVIWREGAPVGPTTGTLL